MHQYAKILLCPPYLTTALLCFCATAVVMVVEYDSYNFWTPTAQNTTGWSLEGCKNGSDSGEPQTGDFSDHDIEESSLTANCLAYIFLVIDIILLLIFLGVWLHNLILTGEHQLSEDKRKWCIALSITVVLTYVFLVAFISMALNTCRQPQYFTLPANGFNHRLLYPLIPLVLGTLLLTGTCVTVQQNRAQYVPLS